MSTDFFTFVDDKIGGLGETDRRILDYVIKNIHTVKNKSVRTLSHECYVSTTTMMRFVRKLGFSGYADFIYQLRFTDDANPPAQMPEWVSPNSFTQHYIENISESLRAVTSAAEKVDSLCRCMRSASQIYLIGDVYCHEITLYAKKIFTSLGISAVFPSQMYEIKYMVRNIQPNAILWLFSVTGEDRTIVDTIERMNATSNTRVVAITGLQKNIISELSDYHFVVLPEMIRLTDEAYSMAPMWAILDFICYNYRIQMQRGDMARGSIGEPEPPKHPDAGEETDLR